MHVGAELRKESIESVYALPDFIFRPQMHQKRLAAGLRPGPLGSLIASPDPLAAVGEYNYNLSPQFGAHCGKGGGGMNVRGMGRDE